MIVRMKKIRVICQAKDAFGTVKELRKLGVLHVEHDRLPQAGQIPVLGEDINLCRSSLDILSRYCPQKVSGPEALLSADWKTAGRHIIDLEKRLDQLQEYSRQLKARIAEWQPWGDFDPEQIQSLARRNIFFRFYQIPVNEIGLLPEKLIVRKVFSGGGIANCVIISREKIEVPYKEIFPPKTSLKTMYARFEQDALLEKSVRRDIVKNAAYRELLEKNLLALEKEMRFQKALNGMGQAGELAYITGFAPFNTADGLSAAARSNQWGISIEDPSETDLVPTLLRNPGWVRIISPVLELLGITPGYREIDVSFLFLIFFSIFFGILIGDAGYGAIYIIATAIVQARMKAARSNKEVFVLLYVLGSCAVIWGVLTGTFFGQKWLIGHGVYGIIHQLNNTRIMQQFCFLLGAIHLSIAHSLKVLWGRRSWTALADVGWICILWSAFFLARKLILAEAMPGFVNWLAAAGIGLVVLFTDPQSNIFKTIGSGSAAIALNLVNNFTDIVSYIRLFAVGLAGVAISETTNAMASNIGRGIFALAAGAIILVIGHGLNLVLGPMSVLVHGVRLNVLEFSGHASVTWGGSAYEPLKE